MNIEIDDFQPNKQQKRLHNFTISGMPIVIRIFFSMNCLETLFEYYKQFTDYRISFAKTVFYMYKKTTSQESEKTLDEDDFLQATDAELNAIITVILEDDNRLKQQYDRLDGQNQYERFYKANDNMFKEAMAPLSKTMNQLSKITQSLYTSQFSAMQKVVEQRNEWIRSIRTPAVDAICALSGSFQNDAVDSISRITNIMRFEGITQQIKSLNSSVLSTFLKFDYPEIQSVLANIPKIDFKFSNILSPLAQQTLDAQASMLHQLQTAISSITKPFASIDFSMLTYHREWSEKHDAFVKFGWFYLNELPDYLLDDIYEQKDSITTSDVDNIIVRCFRNNKCATLKSVVSKWSGSPYFSSRKRLFHEALVNHSRRYYNSSTTLLALHTEGVITDFVRLKLKTPRFKAEKAIADISECMNDIPMTNLTFSDWQIYSAVLDNVLMTFNEQFELSNPDAASNNSRHKIAHGHVVKEETEINSLKRFLYLNEIYRLFSLLDAASQKPQ